MCQCICKYGRGNTQLEGSWICSEPDTAFFKRCSLQGHQWDRTTSGSYRARAPSLHRVQLCQQKLDTRRIWRKVRNTMPLMSKGLETLGRNWSAKNQWITRYIIYAKEEVTDLDKWWVSIYSGVWITHLTVLLLPFFFFYWKLSSKLHIEKINSMCIETEMVRNETAEIKLLK